MVFGTEVESQVAMGLHMTAIKSCRIFMARSYTSLPVLLHKYEILTNIHHVKHSEVKGCSANLHLGSVCQVLS